MDGEPALPTSASLDKVEPGLERCPAMQGWMTMPKTFYAILARSAEGHSFSARTEAADSTIVQVFSFNHTPG